MTKKLLFLSTVLVLGAGTIICADKNGKPTWTDPQKAAAEDPAFLIQGEYGVAKTGQPWAIQVVALGENKLDAYVLEGGFPGLGFSKDKERFKLSGELHENGTASFTGKNKAGESFSGSIEEGKFTLKKGETVTGTFSRVVRQSPTIGRIPPPGAVVLFDGKSANAWNKENLVENGLLKNNDISTKEKFGDYHLHLEFRTPYKPYARGQARGNSGVYHQGRYETQVLDAFGLEGKMNETGGLYSIKDPDLNMCLPPLQWQTYDVDLKSALFDQAGKLLQPARITVKLNGVIIHKDVELPKATPGHKVKFGPGPGPIFLQGHGNPVFYRNIWLIKK